MVSSGQDEQARLKSSFAEGRRQADEILPLVLPLGGVLLVTSNNCPLQVV